MALAGLKRNLLHPTILRKCLIFVNVVSAVFLLTDKSSDGGQNMRSKCIESMTRQDMERYVYWTNSSSCKIVHDFGGSVVNNLVGERTYRVLHYVDGQKSLCMDSGVAPLRNNCLVYSFGINKGWSFDESMERFGCEVFAFDPSIDLDSGDHSAKIHFYKTGIAAENIDSHVLYDWELKTLETYYETLKERHGEVVIDVLKMDVESAEWKIIPQIIRSGMMDRVKQLALEIHFPIRYPLPQFNKFLLKILRSLEEYGMVRFCSRVNLSSMREYLNKGGYVAYELSWFNSKFSTWSA